MSEREYEQSDLYKIRHSAAHVLAEAVLELYPEAKLGIGPPIADGFYYDFDLGLDVTGDPVRFHPEDLPKLEAKMRHIIGRKRPFQSKILSFDEAKELFAAAPYKLELIAEIEAQNERIEIYEQDGFVDLCRGPHVADTGKIPAEGLKLMHIAGAYWRGDENRLMLQRIYGTVWPNKKELKRYLHQLEAAKKRDHRRLGKELELFMLDEEIGPGLPIWLPNGNVLREELEKLAREVEDKAGYVRVATPHIAKEDLFYKSGHLPYYIEEMYPPMEDKNTRYFLKPMNCPFHHKIYSSKPRSYRELPLRLTEYGSVYRYEQSGALFGLMRVRGQQQNDAHIYCAEADFEVEFTAVLDLYFYYFELFGIDKFVMRLSKHAAAGLGKKYVDKGEMWLKMEEKIRQLMHKLEISFVEAEDEAAFYGPKIDVQVWSSIGREFSVATNQVDFSQPEGFELSFINEKGKSETPLCIHRAPLGSHERFIGFLIEHYGGEFPVWLSPEQVRIIPIADRHHAYVEDVANRLINEGVRAKAMLSSDRMNAKIKQAQQMKVPYMIIVGDQEVNSGTISVRQRDGVKETAVAYSQFVAKIKERIQQRSKML